MINRFLLIVALLYGQIISPTGAFAQQDASDQLKEYLHIDVDLSRWMLFRYGESAGGDEYYLFNILVAKGAGGGKYFAFKSTTTDPALELRIIIHNDYQRGTSVTDYMNDLIRIREEYCIGNEEIKVLDTSNGELIFSGKFGNRCFGYKTEERVVRIFFGERHDSMRHAYVISYTVKGRFFTETERSIGIDYLKSASLVY
jgi:hypothetical protein